MGILLVCFSLTFPACDSGGGGSHPNPQCNPACPAGTTCVSVGMFQTECQPSEDTCDPECGLGQVCQNGTCVNGTGGSSCGEVYDCLVECPDYTCMDNCESQASETALQSLDDLLDCIEYYECQTTSCLEDYCANEVTHCFGGSVDQNCGNGVCDDGEYDTCLDDCTGSLTCGEIYECYETCADDACLDECFYQGTYMAQQLADDLEDCLYSSGCGYDDYDCMDFMCGFEIQVCFR